MSTVSSFWDTFSDRGHSHDFVYARANYFRSRVLAVALIFVVLVPVWALFDYFFLPDSFDALILPARIIMMLGLFVAIWLAWKGQQQVSRMYLATALVFLLPIFYYMFVVVTVGPEAQDSLLGYNFIPYMLTAMLAIFPLTLVEGLVLGCIFFFAQATALFLGDTLWSAQGLEALWLLAAILCITLTSSYFHLGLLLRLYREATHDGLTGLLNRTAFIASIEQLMPEKRFDEVIVMMLDLDHFKRLNDTFGHSIGDQVLQEFARIMKRHVGTADYVARYGGEEFVIVMLDANKEIALEVAEAIRVTTEETVMQDHDGRPVQFTVSIGVATVGPKETLLQSMRRADERLYEAKKISRNRVVGV